jgi:hypothetical protein
VRDTVLYEQWAEQTTGPPTTWEDVPVHLALANIPLSNGADGGPRYECIVQLVVESKITGYGTNDGGYTFVSIGPNVGEWFGYPYNTFGSAKGREARGGDGSGCGAHPPSRRCRRATAAAPRGPRAPRVPRGRRSRRGRR